MIEEIVALVFAAAAVLFPASSPDRLHDAERPSRDTVERSVERRPEPPGPSPAAWAALRECESAGIYRINTGNGYFGAYQFDLSTWQSVGGSGYPHEASPDEQDHRALLLWKQRGAQPWPVCGRHLEE